jgi:hypothetical protein
MVKHASNVRKRLRRFLTTDPGRFAGGSAVSDPPGLLAVERERLAALRPPQHDGSPPAAATANQGTQPGPSGDVTGPWTTPWTSWAGAPRRTTRRSTASSTRSWSRPAAGSRSATPGGSPVLDSAPTAVDVTGVTFS